MVTKTSPGLGYYRFFAETNTLEKVKLAKFVWFFLEASLATECRQLFGTMGNNSGEAGVSIEILAWGGYQDIEGRKGDDENKTKIIKNQTRMQSSPLIDPAAPDRHGKVAVTRSKQKATYYEMERLSGRASEGECGVLG